MTTSLLWRPPLVPARVSYYRQRPLRYEAVTVRAFRRSDIDKFARDAWYRANDGLERLLFEGRKAAERFDRQYSVTRRLTSLTESASNYARQFDGEQQISVRLRSFALDFSRNWPRYRKELDQFLATPLGMGSMAVFFLWFALSGWLFRFFIFATWILPFAGPLLIGTMVNNLVVKGACPACKRQFAGYKNQVIRCAGCGNVVWQQEGGFSSKGDKGTKSKSGPDIIDVEFEEK